MLEHLGSSCTVIKNTLGRFHLISSPAFSREFWSTAIFSSLSTLWAARRLIKRTTTKIRLSKRPQQEHKKFFTAWAGVGLVLHRNQKGRKKQLLHVDVYKQRIESQGRAGSFGKNTDIKLSKIDWRCLCLDCYQCHG
jgi:hypothetical protein